jgi:hypothetical protein
MARPKPSLQAKRFALPASVIAFFNAPSLAVDHDSVVDFLHKTHSTSGLNQSGRLHRAVDQEDVVAVAVMIEPLTHPYA